MTLSPGTHLGSYELPCLGLISTVRGRTRRNERNRVRRISSHIRAGRARLITAPAVTRNGVLETNAASPAATPPAYSDYSSGQSSIGTSQSCIQERRSLCRTAHFFPSGRFQRQRTFACQRQNWNHLDPANGCGLSRKRRAAGSNNRLKPAARRLSAAGHC